MTENEVTGRKYRILTNKEDDEWDRVSFWTKASDVHYNEGAGNAENNRPINIIKRNKSYERDDVVYVPSCKKTWAMFVCTTPGQTGSILPSEYSSESIGIGNSVHDGTAWFTLYSVVPSNQLSDSSNQIPAMSLVNDVNSQLTSSNGKAFKFDYQNGTYGYTVDNTFHPFSGTLRPIAVDWSSGTNNSLTSDANNIVIDLEQYPDAIYWDTEHFILVPSEQSTKVNAGTADGSIYASSNLHYYKSYNASTHTLTVYFYLAVSTFYSGDTPTGQTGKKPIKVSIYYCG